MSEAGKADGKQDYGFYGPGSVAWKVGRETAVLLGGSRAVLMQLAHPSWRWVSASTAAT